jgi:hypothetical protein
MPCGKGDNSMVSFKIDGWLPAFKQLLLIRRFPPQNPIQLYTAAQNILNGILIV